MDELMMKSLSRKLNL